MKKAWYYDTPLGKIEIAEDGQGITDLFFCRSERALQAKEEETPLLRKASEEIADYFAGRRRPLLYRFPAWDGVSACGLGRASHNSVWRNPMLSGDCRTDWEAEGKSRRRDGQSPESSVYYCAVPSCGRTGWNIDRLCRRPGNQGRAA